MKSIQDIVDVVNENILSVIPTARVYGISKSVSRDGKIMPAVGEKYVGIDDVDSILVYHKLTGVVNGIVPNTGYGNSRGDQSNTFQMQMIVFNDSGRSKLRDWDLVMIMQANSPRRVNSSLYKAVNISFVSANLVSQQVYAQEYGNNPYPLSFNKSLFQINYIVQAIYIPGCFVECAEELICSN